MLRESLDPISPFADPDLLFSLLCFPLKLRPAQQGGELLDKRPSSLGHHHEVGEVPWDYLHSMKWASGVGGRIKWDEELGLTNRLPSAWLYRNCDTEPHNVDKSVGYK